MTKTEELEAKLESLVEIDESIQHKGLNVENISININSGYAEFFVEIYGKVSRKIGISLTVYDINNKIRFSDNMVPFLAPSDVPIRVVSHSFINTIKANKIGKSRLWIEW